MFGEFDEMTVQNIFFRKCLAKRKLPLDDMAKFFKL